MIKTWCKMYDLDLNKTVVINNIFEEIKLIFLLYRCERNKDNIMKDEFVHVNASIDVFLEFLRD